MRVVILSKAHVLTTYLEERLAAEGFLCGVIYERRLTSLRDRARMARRLARTEGWRRMVDVMAYEIVDRVFRRGEMRRAARMLGAGEPSGGVATTSGIVRAEVASLNSDQAGQIIREMRPDVLIVHATGILKPETFGLASQLAINVHCGVLPEYRGHASTFWALSRGDLGNVGVTLHRVAARVDTGDFFRVGRVPCEVDDTDITLWFKAFALGVDLLCDVLTTVARGDDPGTLPRAEYVGPHYPRKGLSDFVGYRLRRWRQPSHRAPVAHA